MPPGDHVEGVCDGGGGKGQESHDICAPAGGSLQHSTGAPAPTEERRSLQSGCKHPKPDLMATLKFCSMTYFKTQIKRSAELC